MIKNKIKLNNFSQNFFIFSLIFCIILLVILPSTSINAFYEGLIIWATKILPALLPFFILTKLLSYTRFIPYLGKKLSPITKKIYGVDGVSGYVYIMSIISGYPVGAKITADLFQNGIINKNQAETITSFTSTSGPLFILGTVGIGLFYNQKIGLIVLISHYVSALINGLIYRKKISKTTTLSNANHSNNFLNESVQNSIISIMSIGGFIALFYMILQLLLSINAFNFLIVPLEIIGINSNISVAIISGIIEVTSGCILLSELNLPLNITTYIISFLISFGGISVHLQAYCFLKNFNMSYLKFLLQKFTHAIISTIITFLILLVIII